jgi:hypothetical protein
MLRLDLVFLYGAIIFVYALPVVSDPPGHTVTQTMLCMLALMIVVQSIGGAQ